MVLKIIIIHENELYSFTKIKVSLVFQNNKTSAFCRNSKTKITKRRRRD